MSKRKVVDYTIWHPDLNIERHYVSDGVVYTIHSNMLVKSTKKSAFRAARGIGAGTLIFQRIIYKSGRMIEKVYKIN